MSRSDDQPVTLDRCPLRRRSFRVGAPKPDRQPCRFTISCARALDEIEPNISWRFFFAARSALVRVGFARDDQLAFALRLIPGGGGGLKLLRPAPVLKSLEKR
jgi:hypothetical protein